LTFFLFFSYVNVGLRESSESAPRLASSSTMHLTPSTSRLGCSSGSASRARSPSSVSAAAAAPLPRRRPGSACLVVRADLHGLFASKSALFAPTAGSSGSSTPQQRPASSLGAAAAAADPSKRAAFAAVLQGALLGAAAVVLGAAGRGPPPAAEAAEAAAGSGGGPRPGQRSASPALPAEVLLADAQLADEEGGGGGGWGKSHIADRLARQPANGGPAGDDGGH